MDLGQAAQLGEVLSGVGTVAAFVVGLVGLVIWNAQRRQERRSDAASRLLAAVRKACRPFDEIARRGMWQARGLSKGGSIRDERQLMERLRGVADHALENLGDVELTESHHLPGGEPTWEQYAEALLVEIEGRVWELSEPGVAIDAETAERLLTYLKKARIDVADFERRAFEVLGPMARLERTWWSRIVAEMRADAEKDLSSPAEMRRSLGMRKRPPQK